MRAFDELLHESAAIHGHLCAGQVLGVRMAMAGCREVGIEEPRGCKRLLVYVEIDRCATDAIQAVTGCSLGKRTLKFLDYGKMAATFVNTETQKAVRVIARDDAREQAAAYFSGDPANRREAEKAAYGAMPEDLLLTIRPARVRIPARDMPGARGGRVRCSGCGEGISFKREVTAGGRTLCIPCARENGLFRNRLDAPAAKVPQVVLVVGSKKAGKTTLIEKLIPELSGRGYRVGTVKHHHLDSADAYGTDSWRHRAAGARDVALVSRSEIAVFHRTDEVPALDRVIPALRRNDIVLVEGFHREARPKIEITASGKERRLRDGADGVLAVIGEANGAEPARVLSADDITALADLIEREIIKRSTQAPVAG
ncbi:MAG TPA: molybdopterin-guanine dinucleotide biosynthesis protein B [Candidatus Eisenbacteria bacterium]|nr:molybdopterin-guanine dinucleotide biosynthesis protein B [Candidatus Eisenbacteria bacterium]